MTPSFEQAAERPLDRKKYDLMLQETIDQLSLIIDRKYEDIDQLEKIRNKADSCSDTSRKISHTAEMLHRLHEDLNIENETCSNHLNDLQALADFSKKGLEHTINDITRMITDINACITIESQFIQGTSVLLKDVVSSYSRLSRLQAYDQRIIETIKSPLLVVDAYLVAVSANQACYDTFGLSSKTLLGKPFHTACGSCFSMPDDPELKARLQAVFHDGTPLESFEITLQSNTEDNTRNTPATFVFNASRLQRNSEIPSEILTLISMQDITRHRRTESRLRSTLHTMAQMNDELQQKNQELDEFAHIASHDLQDPLNKIHSFGRLLAEGLTDTPGLGPEIEKYLGFMMTASKRMQHLIKALLDLSRSGRGAIASRKIAIDDCVDAALNTLEKQIEFTGAVIERDPLPLIMGDETMITQLYQNLIGNALKFVRKDTSPCICLTAMEKDAFYVLGVQDNGIGIAKNKIEEIFLPFKRLHGTGKYGGGTGIGLSICKKVVERHGGTIWVENAHDQKQGSWFKFTLRSITEQRQT